MTFEEMVRIEPRLGKLRDELIKVMAKSPGSYVKRNNFWYDEVKTRFSNLVGFGAETPELQSCEDYDIAYQELCTILKVW